MKKLIILITLALSTHAFAEDKFCIGRADTAGDVGALFGFFSFDVWCSNGKSQHFNERGCYTRRCVDQFRKGVEKTKLGTLGYQLIKTVNLDENEYVKLYIYGNVNNSNSDISTLDFANKTTVHWSYTGFDGTQVNDTDVKVNTLKNESYTRLDFKSSDSSQYLEDAFKNQTLVQKITCDETSRDSDASRLSEFYIYRKN